MGGENNWICIFEADCGCMVTPAKNRRTPKGASASALAPFSNSCFGAHRAKKLRAAYDNTHQSPDNTLSAAGLIINYSVFFNMCIY